MNRCKEFGCNVKDVGTHGTKVVQICTECGEKHYYDSRDKAKAAHVNRRFLLQPNDPKYKEVYG